MEEAPAVPQPSKEELMKLLTQELDPDLDYHDATAALEAIAKHIHGLHRLVSFLVNSIVTQGNSILDLRTRMGQQGLVLGEHKAAIEGLADMFGDDDADGGLIGMKPTIIMPPRN